MAHLNWPKNSPPADEPRRVVVVPQTPDYDHPYKQRVPNPPPASRAKTATVVAPQLKRSNPARMGLILAVASIFTICVIAYSVMISERKPTREQKQAVSEQLANSRADAQEAYVETPTDYLKVLEVSSVRLAGAQTRAVIDGKVYRVGDLVNERHGLLLVGHDPDGEYLLFRDKDQQVHLLSLYREQ